MTTRRLLLLLAVLVSLGAGIVNSAYTAPTTAQVQTPTATPTATTTLTPSATITTVFFNTPTPTINFFQTPGFTPTPSLVPSCEELQPLAIDEGDIIVVIGGINIRLGPSASTPLVANFPDRRLFTIIGGPVCESGFIWWNIRGHGVTGWVAQNRGDRFWIGLVQDDDLPAIDCLTPLDLVPGEPFTLSANVRIRENPNLAALTNIVAPSGSVVRVLEGPACADGYNWWRVRVTVLGVVYEGWFAESNRAGDPFVNVPPDGDGTICANPLGFDEGERVYVTYNDGVPKRLRNAPNLNAPVLFDLVKNVPMVIVGGPVCAGTYNWWQVRVLASSEVVGWMAEGGPQGYWITSNDPNFSY